MTIPFLFQTHSSEPNTTSLLKLIARQLIKLTELSNLIQFFHIKIEQLYSFLPISFSSLEILGSKVGSN